MSDIATDSAERKEKARRKLSTISNLPSIPYIIFEVNKLVENPSASASQLAQIINKDQGLVTKILSVANSPLYGIPRRVATIDFAIVILGFNHIKNIVVAISMMDAMKNMGGNGFDQKKYWTHSLVTASAAKRLADDLGFPNSGELFTAGLLHDLGLPIINRYFPKEYLNIIKAVQEENLDFHQAEIRELGFAHEEIGKILMDRWNLPETLSDIVLYHHEPANSEKNRQFTYLVHLADYMTHKLMLGDFAWDYTYGLENGIYSSLNLGNAEYMENFIVNYRPLFEEQMNNIKF